MGYGVNLYAYTKNNPVNFVDPHGNISIAAGADVILIALVALGYIVFTADFSRYRNKMKWPPSERDLEITPGGDPATWPNFPDPKKLGWLSIPIIMSILKELLENTSFDKDEIIRFIKKLNTSDKIKAQLRRFIEPYLWNRV